MPIFMNRKMMGTNGGRKTATTATTAAAGKARENKNMQYIRARRKKIDIFYHFLSFSLRQTVVKKSKCD